MGWCAKNMFPTMPAPAFSGNALWGDVFMSACGHRKNICCQKICGNSCSFQATEMVSMMTMMTVKWFLHQNGVEFNKKSKYDLTKLWPLVGR